MKTSFCGWTSRIPVFFMALFFIVGSRAAIAQAPATYTLTNNDDGATVHAAVGDTIEVRLTPVGDMWSVQAVQSPPGMFFRPPFALVLGLQQLWQVRLEGTATITATGTPACAPRLR